MRSLDELWRRQIVREHGADAYDLTHDKLREVAYRSLSTARRRLAHRRVAQALAALYPARQEALASRIAHHYDLAGQTTQAVAYYQQAAAAAQAVHTNDVAIRCYRRALALTDDSDDTSAPDRLVLRERLGDVLHLVARYDEAHAVFAEALEHPGTADLMASIRLRRKIANSLREQYRYDEALGTLQEAASAFDLGMVEPTFASELATERRAPSSPAHRETFAEWLQVQMEILSIYYWRGQVEEGLALCEQIQPWVERWGTSGQWASLAAQKVLLEERRNRYVTTAATLELMRAAMAARLAAGPPTAIPATHFQLGFVLLWHGDLDEAETEMETGLHTAEQMGDLNLQARCLTYLAILQRRRGALNAARRFAERSLAVAARVGMHEYEGLAKANLAWLAWRDNDFSAAEALGAEAMKAWMAACADIERTAAARLAAQHGNPPVFSSVEEMLAGSELDAVLVATPHCALHPVARAAVRAGKHVMVEKPVGIDAQQVRELEEAVKQAGVLCLAGYSFRSFPALKIVRELVDGGTVGEIQAVLGSIGLPPLSGGWPATPETGGGPLLFVGSHLVDEVLWLVGDDPTEVTADVRTRADTGADETAAFQIAFAHGVTAQCLVTQAADGFFNCLDIVGRAGRIGLRGAGFLNYTVEVISKRQPAYSQPTTLRPTWTGDARVAMHVPQLEEFARAIREGGSPAVTLAEARRVMVVLDAVFEAGRTGTVVCIE